MVRTNEGRDARRCGWAGPTAARTPWRASGRTCRPCRRSPARSRTATRATPAGRDRGTVRQAKPDVAGDVLLRRVDECVQRALERAEPQPVVDQLGPALLDPELEAAEVALDGEVLEFLVRAVIRAMAPGASYTSRLLMPTRRSSTMSSRPTPCAPARRLSSRIASSTETGRPSIAVGTPSVKEMTTSSGTADASGADV